MSNFSTSEQNLNSIPILVSKISYYFICFSGVIPKDDIEKEEDSFIACRHCDVVQKKVEKYANGMFT